MTHIYISLLKIATVVIFVEPTNSVNSYTHVLVVFFLLSNVLVNRYAKHRQEQN